MSKTPLFLLAAVIVVGGAIFLLTAKPRVANDTGLPSCAEVLAADTIPVPLSCSQDLGNDAGVATLTIAEDGSLRVTKGERLIFANAEAEDGAGDYMAYDGTGIMAGAVQFTDITYDGYMDIVLLYSAGAYNWTYQYYAYDPSENTYASRPILEATNPDVDIEGRTITSFAKGRGLGDMYVMETFRFEGGAYVLVKRETQDMAGEFDDPEPSYVRTVEELQSGALVETSRETLTHEEVWGDQVEAQ